jgi:hypothetical protein
MGSRDGGEVIVGRSRRAERGSVSTADGFCQHAYRRLHFAQFAPCGACLTHIVFYWPPLHIYRIEAMAAKPDQDAEHVGALQHERMLECDRQPTWLGVLFCRWDNK